MAETPDPNPELAPEGPEALPQEEVSLDGLTAAFAQAMGGRPVADDGEDAPSKHADGATEPPPEIALEAESSQDDNCPVEPRTILEAMLFVGNAANKPLGAQQAADLMRGVEPDEIDELVVELNERYADNGRPYRIERDGTGYRLTLILKFHSLRNRFYGRVRQAKLSQAAIDVLALIAYRQPLTADEVNSLRDKPCGHILSQLVRRGLLRIERKQTKRRTAQYFTTDRFLELFDMQSLEDLPLSEELDRQ